MPISARNQIEGKVADVTLGDIMAHVVVRIGKNQIESVITRRSAEQLGLKKGDKVTVLIKSTEVMLGVESDAKSEKKTGKKAKKGKHRSG